jgi:hypothetical protein
MKGFIEVASLEEKGTIFRAHLHSLVKCDSALVKEVL